jgi:hypothetical protein
MDDLQFADGDPLNDPAWQKAEKPKRRSGRHIGCSVSWLAWVLPLVRSKQQLALALYLYRRCSIYRSNTVTVPTRQLAEFGISRWGKMRLLLWLERVGILTIEQTPGQTAKVRLLHWPDPPDG